MSLMRTFIASVETPASVTPGESQYHQYYSEDAENDRVAPLVVAFWWVLCAPVIVSSGIFCRKGEMGWGCGSVGTGLAELTLSSGFNPSTT